MRRPFAIFLMLIAHVSMAAPYPPVDVEMDLQQVSEHVYYVQGKAGIATDNAGFISNAAAIVTDDGIVIVDALGSPSLAAKFLEKLRAVTDQPVKKVVVTHYHADHIYGLQVFKELGAEIIAPAGYHEYMDSPVSRERLEERRFSLDPWVNESTYLVRPDVVVDAPTRIDLGGVAITVNYLGAAHSDGDLSVLVNPDRVLISGDIIFEGRVPFTGGADTGHWLALLEQLDNTELAALVPGHGPAAKDPVGAVKLTLHYLQKVREVMAEAVDNLTPFDEAYNNADWSEFEALPAFEAAHRKNAYGVYLSMERAQFK
ncbi:MAG: MBL fold metallo-hydrolase [Gammaproteobacteria bacterium]|nr:MBL fold metallo-hydrolase [Gammaproteobacteria bacterium]MCP5136154.1 MBL fold metallo-hydrolase [Gammaproteobacteria bacterium]